MTPPTSGCRSRWRSSGLSSSPCKSSMTGPSGMSALDEHARAGGDAVEKFDDLAIAHLDAAARTGHAHGVRVRAAVDIYVAAHGIDLAEAVFTRFPPAQQRMRVRIQSRFGKAARSGGE